MRSTSMDGRVRWHPSQWSPTSRAAPTPPSRDAQLLVAVGQVGGQPGGDRSPALLLGVDLGVDVSLGPGDDR